MSDRKTKFLPAGTFSGRDAGKAFLITEMSALKAERWGVRATQAVAKAIPLSADIGSEGLAAMAAIGIAALSNIPRDECDDLLDDLLRCVRVVPDPKQPTMTADWLEESFSEAETVAKLRLEAFNLHVNFSATAGPFISALASWMGLKVMSIKTSLELAVSSSGAGLPRSTN
jgi:hypothetical protein